MMIYTCVLLDVLIMMMNRETYHPRIVMGCATENLTLRAIFKSRNKFDMIAIASWQALTAISLHQALVT